MSDNNNMVLEFPLNGIQLDLGTTATFDDISGFLNVERLEGDLPISQTEGNLPVSRIEGNLPLSQTEGNLPVNRIENVSGIMTASDAHTIWANA